MIVTSTLQQVWELLFSWVFAHRHGLFCVGAHPQGDSACAKSQWRTETCRQAQERWQFCSGQQQCPWHPLNLLHEGQRKPSPFWMLCPTWIKCFETQWSCDDPGPEKEIHDSIKITPYLTQCTQVLGLIDLPIKINKHLAWCPDCFGKEGCHEGPQP